MALPDYMSDSGTSDGKKDVEEIIEKKIYSADLFWPNDTKILLSSCKSLLKYGSPFFYQNLGHPLETEGII
ncbi:hypothetical protein BpHYR1_019090 [Brachionus plicatilis]|uniref:Uncharacterized protein n=1 Tax=Brachionus plicatilis TaxID=10195 RepID=A0A3M7SG47_BRAPC|nr:hypothetical protein BpHYR1_019090 [Brachionus plicatilis]